MWARMRQSPWFRPPRVFLLFTPVPVITLVLTRGSSINKANKLTFKKRDLEFERDWNAGRREVVRALEARGLVRSVDVEPLVTNHLSKQGIMISSNGIVVNPEGMTRQEAEEEAAKAAFSLLVAEAMWQEDTNRPFEDLYKEALEDVNEKQREAKSTSSR